MGLIGYGFQHLSDYAAAHFGLNLDNHGENFAATVQPYSLIFIVTAVITWFTPHRSWKRVIIAAFYINALAAAIFKLQYDFTTNYQALSLVILGLGTMLTLPKLELWKKVFIGFVIGKYSRRRNFRNI